MDKSQKEFTEKIRSAIKEKLAEINAFVDDELPDYIMILVANKRSKSQIEKDLILFLGNDTSAFTNWLWDLVKNLKVNSKVKSPPSVPKKDEIYKKSNPQSDEDADVLDYDLDEQESDILDQEDDIKNLPQGVNSRTNKVSNVSSSSIVKTELTASKHEEKEIPDLPQINQRLAKDFPIQEIQSVPVLSTVVPVQQQVVNPEDEYDPTKPDFSGNVSSVVHVSQRKYGGPAALQANKLLLRAVNDATKSVLHGQNINDFYKPTPIKVLSSSRKDRSTRFRNLVNVKIDSSFEFDSKPKEPESNNNLDPISNESELDAFDSENYVISSTPSNNRTICLKSNSTDLNVSEETTHFPICSNSFQSIQDERVCSPHFIVTLDGVDFSLKRKYSETSDGDGSMEVDEDGIPITDNDDAVGSVPEKKQKITERCKYWPACKNSDNCVFHHPTIPCKCFPDCKYGDRCLYIHPNCKFDALCSRKECPYTHASKRKFPFTPVPAKVQVKKRSTKAVCKFYPKCTVAKCPFVHPRLCRYGTKCRLPVCPYSHFNVPSRNQMKWKANV